MSAITSEWTKLRSVPRWVAALVGAVVLTVGVSALGASGNASDINEHPNFVTGPTGEPVSDEFTFAHRAADGDISLTVHVTSLAPYSQRAEERAGDAPGTVVPPTPWTDSAAGITLKDGTDPGASYVSVLLTGHNGVRMQSDFSHDVAGTGSSGTRWLRLTRAGSTVTGYESADGQTWTQIATVTPHSVPSAAQIGLTVSSAGEVEISRGMGGSSLGEHPTTAKATFADLTSDPTSGTPWTATAVKMPAPPAPDGLVPDRAEPPTLLVEADGTYTLTGSGKVGPQAPDDDVVEAALIGVVVGLMALICVGVLFGTSEYRRGLIRTTFAATPQRGRVLAAKVIVLGGVAFVLSLVAVVVTLLVAIPILQDHGMAPPAFPEPSITDGPVIRALLLAALFMTGVTLVGLALGMLFRRSAAAITVTIVLVILPLVGGLILPGTSPRLLMLLTPAGGLATIRTKPPTQALSEPWALIGPWAGISVVAAYAAVALGLAWWRLRRRDA